MRTHVLAAGLAVAVVALVSDSPARAQVAHPSKLVLDEPIPVGPGQTVSGRGAPDRPGIYVELWRKPAGTARAESVASVAVEVGSGGAYSFENVDVRAGETYHVTLSRSWHFDTPGDAEGWLLRQNDLSSWEVSGGALRVTIDDVDGSSTWDPWFMNLFSYDPSVYRVVEIRMRNPAPNPGATTLFALYWGWEIPDDEVQAFHLKDVRKEMTEFETYFFPMNAGERCISSGQVLDGLWFSEFRPCDTSPATPPNAPNNSLRIDPVNGFQSPELNGVVFEVDTIRIREDFRFDFDIDGDRNGIASFHNMPTTDVAGGLLTYTTPGDPSIDFDLGGPTSEFLETAYFSRFAIGLHNQTTTTESGVAGVRFGPGTEAVLSVPLGGRQDVSALLDSISDPVGAWSAQTRIDLRGFALVLPAQPSDGTPVRVDAIGITTEEPFGPSAPVRIGNAPPIASAECEVLPPLAAQARLRLDGSASSDPDDVVNELAFEWRVDDRVVCVGTFDECAVTEVSVEFGTHTVALRVTDPDGAFAEDSKNVTIDQDALASFSIEKAKVKWGESPRTIKVAGVIQLPPGLDPIDLRPLARIGAGLALTEVLAPTTIEFTVHGNGSRKWRFRDDNASVGIGKFSIDWKRPGDDLDEDLGDGADEGEDEDDVDDVGFDLLITDDVDGVVGRYRAEIHFDGDFPAGAGTEPRTLSLDVAIGDQGLAGADVVGPDGFEVTDDKWKFDSDLD